MAVHGGGDEPSDEREPPKKARLHNYYHTAAALSPTFADSGSRPLRFVMPHGYSKADRRCHRKLSALAWERELRAEIHKLADAIRDMDAGVLSPHEVSDRIHAFHNCISRELWVRYTKSDPWISVYPAYYAGYLSDDDLASATDGVVDGLRKFGELRDTRAQLDSPGEEPDGG